MSKRIFAGIFGTSILVLALSLMLVLGTVYAYYSDQYESQLKTETQYVTAGTETDGLDYLKDISDKSSDDANRITWIDGNGVVLYDSKSDVSKMENHRDREEVKEAVEYGSGDSSRYSKTLSVKTHYYAERLSNGTIIRLAVDQNSWISNILGSMKAILAVILAAAALSVLIAYRLTVRITRPLNEISLSDGDTEEPEGVYDELEPLISRISSQRKQIAENIEEIRRQQDDFNKIIDNMEEGLIVLDHRNTVLSCNSSAADILDADRDAIGRNVLELTLNRTVRDAVDEASRGGSGGMTMEIGERVYSVIYTPVLSSDSQEASENEDSTDKTVIRGTVLVILDTTEREERDRLRREFTANVTHELKTPLTSVLGYSEIMKSGLARPEDTKQIAGKIHDEAERLLNMIDDILKLSRLEENGATGEREEVDLADVSGDVIKRLSDKAENMEVTVSQDGESAEVNTIRSVADEMIYNVVENAVKYNKAGGSVIVTTGKNGEGSYVRVTDTGTGISEADQKRVFERFYRGDKSHSSQVEGTGLGLAIVRHGAEVTGAHIAMKSQPGRGTEVTIVFP